MLPARYSDGYGDGAVVPVASDGTFSWSRGSSDAVARGTLDPSGKITFVDPATGATYETAAPPSSFHMKLSPLSPGVFVNSDATLDVWTDMLGTHVSLAPLGGASDVLISAGSVFYGSQPVTNSANLQRVMHYNGTWTADGQLQIVFSNADGSISWKAVSVAD